MGKVRNSAIALAPVGDDPMKFYVIECAKGRGSILPGGKWEVGETFKETAQRELFEETGIKAVADRLIFNGQDRDGYHCYMFLMRDVDTTLMRDETREGVVRQGDWWDLMTSPYFKAYYELAYDEFRRMFPPVQHWKQCAGDINAAPAMPGDVNVQIHGLTDPPQILPMIAKGLRNHFR